MTKRVAFQKRFPKEWVKAGDNLAKAGATATEIHAEFGISTSEHEALLLKEPLYGQQFERWETMALAFYLKLGRENLDNKSFNYKEWLITMRNLFGWNIDTEKPSNGGMKKKNVDDTGNPQVHKDSKPKESIASRYRLRDGLSPEGEVN